MIGDNHYRKQHLNQQTNNFFDIYHLQEKHIQTSIITNLKYPRNKLKKYQVKNCYK